MKKFISLSNPIYRFYLATRKDILFAAVFLSLLYILNLVSLNIFFFVVELFCVVIAFSIFIVAWNARNFLDNHFLLFLSLAYISITIIDVINVLTYGGMQTSYFFISDANVSTQLWIASRYLQGFSLLAAPYFLNKRINIRLTGEIFVLLVFTIFFTIYYLKIFPVAYVETVGTTLFKDISEYLIIFLFGYSAIYLLFKKKELKGQVFYPIFFSIVFMIASEWSFAAYMSAFGFKETLPIYFRMISFLLLYKTIIETGLRHPLSYIFRDLEKHAQILKASELKLSSLVELATDAVILTSGHDHRIDLWNNSAKKIFGWSSKEVKGKPLDFIFLGKNRGQKFDIRQLIKQKDSVNSLEYFGVRKNGEIFPLEISFSAWKINNEELNCYIIRDITERKQIELELINKQKKMEGLINDLKIVQLSMDNAFTHIIITDENGYILYANKSAEELTGFSRDEMVGKRPSLWGRQMPASFYEDFWKTIKQEKRNFSGEITNRKKNGTLYQAEIRVSPVLDSDGEVRFFVAIERDITEEKEIEKAKSEFISLAAHQLRTPLSTISLSTEMLLKGIVGGNIKEGKKYLRNISKEIKGMTEMIRIFLDVSRVEVNKFPVEAEPVKLFEFIEKTIHDVLPQIKYKKINLKKNYKKSLPTLNIDKNVFKIILENLLSNAIKYSPKKGKIILSVEENDGFINIKVKDNGIGIPEKNQQRIFTKMFRAENVSSIKSEGSGLGLYLAKNLALQNGYDISFESKENQGSTFMLSIPSKEAVRN